LLLPTPSVVVLLLLFQPLPMPSVVVLLLLLLRVRRPPESAPERLRRSHRRYLVALDSKMVAVLIQSACVLALTPLLLVLELPLVLVLVLALVLLCLSATVAALVVFHQLMAQVLVVLCRPCCNRMRAW
jgi:hypothetical protein